jgi:hypothetical protein
LPHILLAGLVPDEARKPVPSSSLSGGDFETSQPPYGPAPAPLAGPELPSFRFPLGTVAPKTFQGGTAKEATVAEFPVSDKLGVSI